MGKFTIVERIVTERGFLVEAVDAHDAMNGVCISRGEFMADKHGGGPAVERAKKTILARGAPRIWREWTAVRVGADPHDSADLRLAVSWRDQDPPPEPNPAITKQELANTVRSIVSILEREYKRGEESSSDLDRALSQVTKLLQKQGYDELLSGEQAPAVAGERDGDNAG